MPTIKIGGQTIECAPGDNLRKVLLSADAKLYNRLAGAINCRGLGTCGTCAVQIVGQVSDKTAIENWRLNLPPHRSNHNLRLACQCSVLGDLQVTKFPGFWGQRTECTPAATEQESASDKQ